MIKTPVVFIVFNRPTQTKRVFQAIAAAKPQKLLIIADGPRSSRPGEDNVCQEVRAITNEIDWPCEVLRNFSETNLGCCERVVTGLDWAFSLVSEAIILEDDCLPHADFFTFCEELLERYRADDRIGIISGTNLDPANRRTEYSYYFSRIGGIWGWATWRKAWERYDQRLCNWKAVEKAGMLSETWSNHRSVKYWSRVFDSMYQGTGPNTWDYQWVYTRLINSMLSVVPSVNMVRNIGFGADATHTSEAPKWARGLLEQPIDFPLKHPPYVMPMRSFDDLDQRIGYPSPTLTERVIGKVKRAGSHIRRALPPKIAIT